MSGPHGPYEAGRQCPTVSGTVGSNGVIRSLILKP